MWTPVVAVGLYLILTLVILISSIDSIQFSAHELYGAPFIAAMMLAMVMWSIRDKPQRVFYVILSIPLMVVASGTLEIRWAMILQIFSEHLSVEDRLELLY